MVNFWFYIVSGEKIWEHFCVLLGMMYHQVWANVLCWMSTVSIHNLNIFTLFAYRFLNLKGTNLFEELTLVHWIILQLALFLFWKKTQRDHPFKTSANSHYFWSLPLSVSLNLLLWSFGKFHQFFTAPRPHSASNCWRPEWIVPNAIFVFVVANVKSGLE